MTDRDDVQLILPVERERPSIAARFTAFDEANPHVYRLLVRLAREYRTRTGGQKIGVAALVERARWELALSTTGDAYKINNDYRSFYARMIAAREPDLADAFELRQSVADGAIGRVADGAIGRVAL